MSMRKSLLLFSGVFMSAICMTAAIAPQTFSQAGSAGQDLKLSEVSTLNETPVKLPAKADAEVPTIKLGYAEDPYKALHLNGVQTGQYIYLMFEIPAEDLAAYDGCEISSMNIYSPTQSSGSNKIRKIEIFVTDSPFTSLGSTNKAWFPTTGMSECLLKFTTPHLIDGTKPLYAGYRFEYDASTMSEMNYAVVDYEPNLPRTFMAAVGSDSETLPDSYGAYGASYGALCMSLNITGDKLPRNYVKFNNISVPSYFPITSRIAYDVEVRNMGLDPVSSIHVNTTLSDGTTNSQNVSIDPAIPTGETATARVTKIQNSSQGVFYLTSEVDKANNATIAAPRSLTTTYSSYDNGYPRRLVMEEFTGTWCRYCPRGIVMMEYLKEHYPDWIRIAAHNDDPMMTESYNGVMSDYCPGFPSAVCNRLYSVEPAFNDNSYYAPVYNELTSYPSYACVDFTAEYDKDAKKVDIKSTTEFSYGMEVPHLLSFVLVEDGVGPFSQQNAFANAGYDCGGWESKGSVVSTVYDDVARHLTGYPGNPDSLPETVEADTPYEYSTTISTVSASGDKLRVVALITNTVTGEIVNAKEVALVGGSGVDNLVDDDNEISISVSERKIIVSGTEDVLVSTLDGRIVGNSDLAPGLYIVKAGVVCRKFMVK